MGDRSFNLIILLAMTIALGGVCAGWGAHHADADNAEHIHLHDHSSDSGVDSHAHHHREHSESDDWEDSEHYHCCDLDRCPDIQKINWTGPRRIDNDAPSVPSSQLTVVLISIAESEPAPRANPPPRSIAHAQQLSSIRTVILRL